jgi:hypothetical protein
MGDDWQDEAKRLLREKLDSNSFKPRQGNNSVRILPAKISEGKFGGRPFYRYLAHGDVGPEKRFIRCGKDFDGKGKCILCDQIIPKMSNSAKPEIRKRAAQMEPKEQFVVQVAYLDEDGRLIGPKPWRVSAKNVQTEILGRCVDPEELKKITSLKNGYNINFKRTGEQMQTRYALFKNDQEPTTVPSRIVAKIKSWDDLVRPYSKGRAEAAYWGREFDEEMEDEDLGIKDPLQEKFEEEEDEAPKKVAGKKKAKPPVEEDEDDETVEEEDVEEEDEPTVEEDEEEEEVEEEEEEPIPVKKKATKKSPVVEDEEDEPAEDDEDEEMSEEFTALFEDEEEEAPASKKPAAKKKKK